MRTLLVGLIVALAISACAPTQSASTYRVTFPTMQCRPHGWVDKDGDEIIVLCLADFAAFVRELRAACIALGQPSIECGGEK